jgi:hypothetical protein
LWKRFTTRSVHLWACQFTQTTSRLQRCLTRLHNMLGKSCPSQSSSVSTHFVCGCRTLQRFDSCLRSQRELGKIKRLFKQGEITAQLNTCETELRALLVLFTVSS